MPSLLAAYQRLPYPLRVAVASARGWQLRRWRTSPDTERLIAEALERDSWTPERWGSWRSDRLPRWLDHAARNVPYYREHWRRRRLRGDRSSWEELAHWPILAKAEVRARRAEFRSDDARSGALQELHTSGTTGSPLHLWRSREASVAWYALFAARVHRWNGVTPKDRWAVIGGQLVASVRRTRPPFWVWNAAMGQLYLSSYHLSAANVPSYLEAMRRHGVRCLEGYPSAMYALAAAALRAGLDAPPLRLAVSNAEPLFDRQREAIAEAFRSPVRNTYGMAEIAAGASECERGSLHLWPDAGVLELIETGSDTPVRPGQVGRIVATGLLNRAMPLVRYEVGDLGAAAPDDRPCECGRLLPVLHSVEGRSDDVVVTPDGRRIGRLDPVFKGELPILEAQIIQETEGRLRVRFVPAAEFGREHGELIVRRLRERVGDLDVVLEPVDAIRRSANGKFRAVVSLLSRDEERAPGP